MDFPDFDCSCHCCWHCWKTKKTKSWGGSNCHHVFLAFTDFLSPLQTIPNLDPFKCINYRIFLFFNILQMTLMTKNRSLKLPLLVTEMITAHVIMTLAQLQQHLPPLKTIFYCDMITKGYRKSSKPSWL